MNTNLTFSGEIPHLRLQAHGRWTVDRASMLESEIAAAGAWGTQATRYDFDLSDVDEFDTHGVWLLERLRRRLLKEGKEVRFTGMDDASRPLFAEMATVNTMPATPSRPVPALTRMADFLGGLGNDLTDATRILGASIVALAGMLAQPRRFRVTSTIHQFDRVGWRALPIILLVTLIIGAIIAQQGFFHFRDFGADLYVIDMIGFLIMREIGVLLVSIMVAGRSGSAFTAELGSMKMREEIDALRTMDLDPVGVLVVPRTLALVIALPILTFIGSLAALTGAGLVAVFYAGLSPDLFIDRLREAISLDHLQVGLIKAPFIGLVIGIIACTEGFRVAGSTTSLGHHTTQSVVKSIFMVIVLDGLFALFFSGIGM